MQYPLCTTGTGPNNSVLIKVSPQPNSLNVNALFTPVAPEWKFTTGSLGQYVFSGSSVNFELDISEQTNLIIGILKYCGLIINDPTIIQSAAAEAQEVEQNIKS